MTDRTHPDSGRIITSGDILLHDAQTALMYEELRAAIDDGHESMTHADALAEIAAIRAENVELRAQLEAIGAGGVAPLIGQQTRDSFTAADMATASAQGFRDGVASLSANAGEPVAWQYRSLRDNGAWFDCTKERFEMRCTQPEIWETRALYAAPPTAQAEGWTATAQHQTYRCKIKSRKQIDKEIPRDQQGWWADVAAGQKLLLRPAVQADIDRCHLGGRRSKNPDDYMCETQTNGSLVSKIALEYMNPEENVFAAIPAPPTSAEGVEHG